MNFLIDVTHQGQIECEIEISTEKNIEYERSINLFIILLNLLFKSIYNTPRKGKVIVRLAKRKHKTLIHIQDNAFDLKVSNHSLDSTFSAFLLSDVTLNFLAESSGFKIIKNPGEQSNTTDLVIAGNAHKKPTSSVRHGNIVPFPKNA